MKLNNRGWGLRTMLAFCAILIVAAFISHSIYKSTFGPNGRVDLSSINNGNYTNTTNKKYEDYESELKSSAKLYINQEEININEGETYTISVNELVKKNYVKALSDGDGTCSGYIFINSNGIKPYLNCNEYKTTGYDSELGY